MYPLLRALVSRTIKSGTLIITDSDGVDHRYGDGTGQPVHVRIATRAWERAIAFDGALKLPEAYMEGALTFRQGDLYGLLDLVFSNVQEVGQSSLLARIGKWARFAGRRIQQLNTLAASSKNVQHHYDISNDLYRTFLDADWQYSCSYFEVPGQSLDESQLAKKRHITAKLLTSPGQSVLDIGCGWGGLGLYLADIADMDVTGVTLSKEQLKLANERAAKKNLTDRARFLECDYRKYDKAVDRIVSVGMFEHVGVNHYATFFRKCAELLKEDGVMLLHAIGRSEGPGITNPFIAKYIFPGGYIPALSEVLPHIERAGLRVTDVEILRLHYAETLRHWRERFMTADLPEPYASDERFKRMWEFYLVGSEIGFRRQGLMVFQIQIAKAVDTVPLTRNYIQEEERRLANLETERAPRRTPASDAAKRSVTAPAAYRSAHAAE